MYARRRPGRRRAIAIILPGTVTKTHLLESLVAYHRKSLADSIPEEVLGIDRALLTGSQRCGKSSSGPSETHLGQGSRPSAATVE